MMSLATLKCSIHYMGITGLRGYPLDLKCPTKFFKPASTRPWKGKME